MLLGVAGPSRHGPRHGSRSAAPARFAAAVKSGQYGSNDEAVLMAALTMFLDDDAQLEEKDRLLDEAEESGCLTEEEYQASMLEYWAQRRSLGSYATDKSCSTGQLRPARSSLARENLLELRYRCFGNGPVNTMNQTQKVFHAARGFSTAHDQRNDELALIRCTIQF